MPGMEVYHVQGEKKMRLLSATADDGTGQDMWWMKLMQEILSVCLIRVFFLLEIPSVCLERNLPLKEFLPLHRSILQECARWIP